MIALTLSPDYSIVRQIEEEQKTKLFEARCFPSTITSQLEISQVSLQVDESSLSQDSLISSAIEERVESLFTEAIEDITRYERFPTKWDGYNAPSFNQDLVNYCKNFLLTVRSYIDYFDTTVNKISPCPCPDGSIDLEIATRNKTLVLNFSNDLKDIGIFFEDESTQEIFDDVRYKIDDAPLVENLFRLVS